MKKSIKITLFFCVLTIFSCGNNDDTIKIYENNNLIGFWVNPVYNGDEVKYKRAKSLKEDGYGIAFLIENVFIERSSGFCGTPPLVYHNQEGTWQRDDSVIHLRAENGIRGLMDFQWKIIAIDDKYLILNTSN